MKSQRMLHLFLSVFLLTALFCGCNEEKKKPLLMVTDATFPPYEFRDGKQITGIDPEIIRELAKAAGRELIIEDMSFDSIIAAVQSGKADIAASGITVTEDRKKKISFTHPYVTSKQVIIVTQKSTITDAAALKGKRIGVQHGTTGDTYVTSNIQQPERYQNGALAVRALISGKLDAVVLDNEPARVHVSKFANLKILSEPLLYEQYAFAVAKNNTELLNTFNTELTRMKTDGRLQAILEKYLNKESTAAVTSHNSAWQKFKASFKLNFLDDDRYLYLAIGFLTTLEIAICAVLLGVLIGFIVAVIRSTADRNGNLKLLNMLCKFYLTVIRGTPVVVQLLLIYFVIFGSMDVDKVLVAIIAFGINSGAYVAEIIRGGINSIDNGQMEAARSLGLSYPQAMIRIILPQALKNVLPALGNEFIVLLKETSVSGYIALQDLTKGGDIIRSQTYDAFLPLIAVALIYLAVVMLFSSLLTRLERRLKNNE